LDGAWPKVEGTNRNDSVVGSALNRSKWTAEQAQLGAHFSGLPIRQLKLTVLKSPHIDKKSREQFSIKIHKSQWSVKIAEFPQISFFLYLLKITEFPGLEVVVSIHDII
jgi:ribosomal protein S10